MWCKLFVKKLKVKKKMCYVYSSTYYKTSRKPQGSETCCALAGIAQTKSSYSSGRLIRNDQPRPIVVINPRGRTPELPMFTNAECPYLTITQPPPTINCDFGKRGE